MIYDYSHLYNLNSLRLGVDTSPCNYNSGLCSGGGGGDTGTRFNHTDMPIRQFDNTSVSESNKFKPKKVIFNNPATIVFWSDGSKTLVKCGADDVFDKEKGLALCYMKKALGNKGNFNNMIKEFIDYAEDN